MLKVSEMLIEVGGKLLSTVSSKEEMQAHLDLVTRAWNMAIEPPLKRKRALKAFLKNQKKYAPSHEALKGLESEIIRVMKQKDILFPHVDNRIAISEAIEKGKDDYLIRAIFAEDHVH